MSNTPTPEEPLFESGPYETEHEAAFAYNVAALVLHGPDAELNEGLNLTLERKKQIEKEVLAQLRQYLELPRDFKFGRFPRLYGQPASGFYRFMDDNGNITSSPAN